MALVEGGVGRIYASRSGGGPDPETVLWQGAVPGGTDAAAVRLALAARGGGLSSAHLSGADLAGLYAPGADLSRADLRGACLDGALLAGGRLDGARLDGASARGLNLV